MATTSFECPKCGHPLTVSSRRGVQARNILALVAALIVVAFLVGRQTTGARRSSGSPDAAAPADRAAAAATQNRAADGAVPAAQTAAAPGASVARADVVLDIGGLRAVPFGTPERDSVATLTAAFGPPAADHGECTGATIETWGPLAVVFRDDGDGPRFRGWSYTNAPGAPRLVTTSGLAPGITVDRVKQAYAARNPRFFEDQLFGPRFSYTIPDGRTFGGTLTSLADDGIVTSFFAGDAACE